MDLRKKRTLKLVSTSLVELLREKPYEYISVSEICEGAMVRRATFYRHFSNKNELLAYVISEKREEYVAKIDASGDLPLREFCKNMTIELLLLLNQYSAVIEKQRLSASFDAVITLLIDTVADEFACKLSRTREDNTRCCIDGNYPSSYSYMIANFYAAGLVSALKWKMRNGNEVSDQDFLNVIDEMATRLFE